ncbi:MAG: hypothetical protein J1E80_01730 [Desulfovibrionaceae bacterium]|nr:hypothetical protein [Desulfovibrionaceae bacterium]
MQYENDLIRLAIRQTALIDQAWNVLRGAEEELMQALCIYIKQHIPTSFIISEIREGLWFNFWNPTWCRTPQQPVASFWIGHEGGNDYSWLSILTRQIPATGTLCFQRDSAGIYIKDWKSYLINYFASTPAFEETGFRLSQDGNKIIIPIELNVDELAENYPKFDVCFGSINPALKAINTMLPEFEKIIEAIKNWGK